MWAKCEHIYEKAPFGKTGGVLTFEFSGLIFLVLISWSVETSLFHHSILLIWRTKKQKYFIFPGLALGILCLSHRKKLLESSFDSFLNVSKIWTWIKGAAFILNHFRWPEVP